MTNDSNRPWPYDRPARTAATRIASLLIADWRWQRFDETCVPDPDGYPAFGWLRIRIEETEAGELYELREWQFAAERPDSGQAAAA